jgi:hypothetical protein
MSSQRDLTVEEQAEIDRQVGIFRKLHPRLILNQLNQSLLLGFLRTHRLNPDATTLSFAYASLEKELDLLPLEARPQAVSAKPQREINVRPRLSSRHPQSEAPAPEPITVSPEIEAFAEAVISRLGGARR